ncbi:TNF receptor-associated factor 5-like [Xenia sp. Carnegie-2017]|uniref:TNF receptor-associated factor 5-like n=1 Tax=Xenia sp. Carnegie-2017 TaxID=2897299 RepID=UPI001F046B29|nr:TNF receptor-associated factor 5-like [Xenia sp. Carnegie-2017]
MPGIKIRDVDRKKIPAKYICTSCHFLLVNPTQTMCGHLFCQSCIDIILGSSNPKCPEDQEKLSRNDVFPDAFTKRELKSIRLHCPSEQCEWFGSYEELEGHYQVCEHALISCIHKQYNIQLPRSLLSEHLKNKCEYRNVKCEYCGKDVPYASLKDHIENVCEYYPVVCEYCGKKIPRKDIEQHQTTACDEVPTECEFQAIGCSYDRVRIYELFYNFMSVMKYTTLKLFANKIFIKSASISNDESLARNTVKITDLEAQRGSRALGSNQAIHSYNGTLLWKIDNFKKKRQNAINGIKTALYSVPFYSSQYGYKMCAKIYMNGDGFGKGTHLSLFFVVMKGDNDALQTWPFQKKITMMLMDQGNGDHMIDAFHSDPQSSENLNNHQYIKGEYKAVQKWPFHKNDNTKFINDCDGKHMVLDFHLNGQSSSLQRPTSNINDSGYLLRRWPLECLSRFVKDDTLFFMLLIN